MASGLDIPVRNLFFLLCYAWDVLDQREAKDFGAIPGEKIDGLLAYVLSGALKRLLRLGLERDYDRKQATIGGIRGKLALTPTLSRGLLQSGKAVCTFDVLSSDTEANRAIKATIRGLAASPEVDGHVAHELRLVAKRLPEVSDVRLRRGSFRQIQFHRNNRLYRLLINICRFWVARNFPDEVPGDMRFSDFDRTDEGMRKLFESFVRNLYRHELPQVQVEAFQTRWSATAQSPEMLGWLPALRTDVCLRIGNSLTVLDTKFTTSARDHFDARKLKESHLNQISAYLHNLKMDARFTGCKIAGVLLYPMTRAERDLEFSVLGFPLLIRHVDLAAPWDVIRGQVLAIPADTQRILSAA